MDLKIDNAAIEKMANDQIRIAVAGVLAKNSDAVIARIVDVAMTERPMSSYGTRETYGPSIVDRAVIAAIQDEASKAVALWIDEKRPEIQRRVYAALSAKKDGLVAAIVTKLVGGMKDLDVSVWLRRGE